MKKNFVNIEIMLTIVFAGILAAVCVKFFGISPFWSIPMAIGLIALSDLVR